jgi:hypothetical protein
MCPFSSHKSVSELAIGDRDRLIHPSKTNLCPSFSKRILNCPSQSLHQKMVWISCPLKYSIILYWIRGWGIIYDYLWLLFLLIEGKEVEDGKGDVLVFFKQLFGNISQSFRRIVFCALFLHFIPPLFTSKVKQLFLKPYLPFIHAIFFR